MLQEQERTLQTFPARLRSNVRLVRGGRWVAGVGLAIIVLVTMVFIVWGVWHRSEPAIQSVFPVDGATGVSVRTRVQVSFDGKLASIDAVEIAMTKPDGTPVDGAMVLNDTATAVRFAPAAALSPGKYRAMARVGTSSRSWSFTVPDAPPLNAGPGGPILLIYAGSSAFEPFYAEILRTEGLTDFATSTLADVTPQMLSGHAVAILVGPVDDLAHVAMIREWVDDGGRLVAMRPSGEMAALAGLQLGAATLADAYLRIDASTPPGAGLVSETIQFHGPADIAAVTAGTRIVAALYRDADTNAEAPAVTVRKVGSAGGEIAAFTFDLAQSVALTRQGNPEWSGQERDGLHPIRPSDLFHGGAGAHSDYIDLDKVAIPQADEQMRLLSNTLAYLTQDRIPLPKFWYFPKGYKAVLVMAADDHGTPSGTRDSFDRMLALKPQTCSVQTWECARATSWMTETARPKGWRYLLDPRGGARMNDNQAAYYWKLGFDIGAHVNTQCENWSEQSLNTAFARDLLALRLALPSLPPQQDSRLHCIAWSDYVSQPRIGRAWGIRYDMNYYYWPASWIQGRAGFMTGSGLPMRFSDAQGGMLNVYQQETHLVDEVFGDQFDAVSALIDRALGPKGYYGAFGTHYDFHNDFDQKLMKLAIARDIPMVSAQQMLDWTDGRQASRFSTMKWDGDVFSFEIQTDALTGKMLQGMMPVQAAGGRLLSISRGDETIAFTAETIKGVDYGLFSAEAGSYTARYSRL